MGSFTTGLAPHSPRTRDFGDILNVVRDYARYKDFYGPAVIDSGRVSQVGAQEYEFSMVVLNQALFQKNALEGEYSSSYVRLDDRRRSTDWSR